MHLRRPGMISSSAVVLVSKCTILSYSIRVMKCFYQNLPYRVTWVYPYLASMAN